MRKFKHKSTGKVFIKTDFFNPEAPNESYYKLDSETRHFYLEKEFIENSNDWEEANYNVIGNMDVKEDIQFEGKTLKHVKIPITTITANTIKKEEPNYLITAFRFKDYSDIWNIKKNGLYGPNDSQAVYTLEEMLEGNFSLIDDTVEIHSVKNSTGEEFTIGDLVDTNHNKMIEIKSFNIRGEKMEVITNIGNTYVDFLSKSKTPIYTTDDGKKIFEGDNVSLFIYTDNGNKFEAHIPSFDKSEAVTANKFKCFISEENRDKYIKENQRKPIFTSADGKEIFEGDTIYIIMISFNDNSLIIVEQEYDRWKNMFTENKQYNNVFSTKELAQEYIDNNKPKYSLTDIENAYCKAMNSEFDGLGEIVEELKKLGK